jgi:CRISPR-associated endonuclease Csn1
MRRVMRRRRQRMAQLRALFQQHGLLPDARRDALRFRRGWTRGQLRRGWRWTEKLAPEELAVALGHIARHRGFRSNKKNAGQ